MTDLAPHLSAFLQEYLPNERQCSRHTLQGYTECFRLLVAYAAQRIRARPCKLKIEHFTVALLSAFLEFLNARGRAMSTDGFAYLLDKHVATAAKTVAPIKTKRVTPHVLRHYIDCMTMSGNQATETILIREYSFVGEHREPITRHSLRRATGC